MLFPTHPPRGGALTLLLTILIAGCDGEAGPAAPDTATPVPTTLQIADAAPVTVYVPSDHRLEAAVLDQWGQPMGGEPITFESRDPTTAAVAADGTVTAVAGGEAWILATSGSLRDSVLVEVRYHVLTGEANARIRGNGDIEQAWGAGGAYLDLLRTPDGNRLAMTMGNLAYPDTTLMIILPSAGAGVHPIERSDVQTFMDAWFYTDLEAYSAYLIMETDNPEQVMLYVAIPGSVVEIEDLSVAPDWGMTGDIRGRASILAEGHRVTLGYDYEPVAVPTGDTISVFVDFALEYLHWAIGQADFTLEGGPSPETAEGREAWWIGEDWGRSSRIRVEDGPPWVDIETDWPIPGVVAVDSVGPEDPQRTPGAGAVVSVELAGWTDVGYGIGGTVTFEEVVAPGAEAWGLVKGHADVDLGYWDRSSWPGSPKGTGTMRIDFDAVVLPDEGPSLAVLASEEDPRWWRTLRRELRKH